MQTVIQFSIECCQILLRILRHQKRSVQLVQKGIFVCSHGPCKMLSEYNVPLSLQVNFCLDDFTSAEELESVGMERLKQELMARGLKCGGTLQQRAQRLFATKGVPLDQLDPSFFAKPTGSKKSNEKK